MVQLRKSSRERSTAAPFSGRRGSWRRVVTSIAGAALLASGFVAAGDFGAAPAAAAPGDPFSPDEPVVFVAQGDDRTQLYEARANEITGEWEFEATGSELAFRHNALGYNKADNFLYAIVENGTGVAGFPDRALVRIGQNGVATNTGFVLPGTSMPWSGAFNDDDGYFYVATSHGVNTWVIDVSGTTPTLVRQMPQSAAENVFDFTYADGFFWGMNGDGIRRINPSTGASQFFPVPDSWG